MLTERERFIVFVDNDILVRADAIVLLEGDGVHRARQAASLYCRGFAPRVVFTGGADNPGYGSFLSSIVIPELERLGVPSECIVVDDKPQNTREQAVGIVRLATEQHWERIILVASHYHQYRAYLTFLQAMFELGATLLIVNAPADDLPWFQELPWGVRAQLLDEEFEKIEEYNNEGHIASFTEAIQYQKWKEQQP